MKNPAPAMRDLRDIDAALRDQRMRVKAAELSGDGIDEILARNMIDTLLDERADAAAVSLGGG